MCDVGERSLQRFAPSCAAGYDKACAGDLRDDRAVEIIPVAVCVTDVPEGQWSWS